MEEILTIWGVISLVWILILFLNKKLFRDQIKLKSVVEKMRNRMPNERNSGEKIDLLKLSYAIQQYDLSNYQNRYAMSDIEEYISDLEKITNENICKKYSIKNLLRLLYQIKDSLNKNDDFQVKFNSLVLGKVVIDRKYDQTRFRKFIEFFSA